MAKEMVCLNCGTKAKPKLKTKGSIFIEIILWLCFLIPGLIYSVWRHATRYKACPACGAFNMAPPDSPAAQKLFPEQANRPPAPRETTPATYMIARVFFYIGIAGLLYLAGIYIHDQYF